LVHLIRKFNLIVIVLPLIVSYTFLRPSLVPLNRSIVERLRAISLLRREPQAGTGGLHQYTIAHNELATRKRDSCMERRILSILTICHEGERVIRHINERMPIVPGLELPDKKELVFLFLVNDEEDSKILR